MLVCCLHVIAFIFIRTARVQIEEKAFKAPQPQAAFFFSSLTILLTARLAACS